MAILGPANQLGGPSAEPDSGFFDPATGDPIPTSQIGNFSFVKDAQGVFRSVTIVTDQVGNQFFEFNVADPGLLQDLGFLPKEGGTGGSAPSFASTQAAQTQAEQAAAAAAATAAGVAEEAAAARRAFDEEQAEIDRELRLREARLATARDLVGIRSAEAREARKGGVELAGEDPFRFTAVARGLAGPTGTTPSAGFKQNLAQAGNFQAPELAGLDSNALESVIGKLSQSITPGQTNPFGFAHGGVLSPSGAQGGTGAQAVPIGENGPEIMILRPDGSVEIVPMAQGAQQGGVFDFGGFGSLFSSLRQSVGVGNQLPGFFGQRNVLPAETASRLGARQRGFGSFVRQGNDPTVFMVTSQGLRSVGSRGLFEGELGGSFGDVESLSPDAFARLQSGVGTGETFTAESARGFEPQRGGGTFGAFGQPLTARGGLQDLANATPGFGGQDVSRINQLIGFLPAPFKIPPTFFNSLLPAEKQALISAYRLAGVSEADFGHLLTAPQLSFTPQRATAIG